MNSWRPSERPALWRRLLPEALHVPVIWLFRLGLLGGLVVSAVAFGYWLTAMRFDLAEVGKLPAGTTFYDRHGTVFDVPGRSTRRLSSLEDVPDFLIEALQAREDARFFEHGGVDLRGLARATLRNLKDREFTQGASTLTMQLARNTYENMRAKSLHRKFLEIALTYRIEARHTKQEILLHYLNRIYFGAGADGLEQAAHTYFGKPAAELNEGECAMLVGIIRGPHIFSPFRNLEGAVVQRDETLDRMVASGRLDENRKEEIAALPIRLLAEDKRDGQRSHALVAVRRELDRILADADIAGGSLHVHMTLDSVWQARLEEELERAARALEGAAGWEHPTHAGHEPGQEPGYLQYSAITTETRSGAVLAWIGGRDYGHSRYDRSRSRRDLGAAFEPFVAAAAAERGKLVLRGKPVLTGRQIGPAEVARLAKRCGLAGPFGENEDLFRGDVSATPMELALGLATFGNQGLRPKPFLIREVKDGSGKVLYRAEPRLTRALGHAAARDAASILEPRGGGTRGLATATASRRDAWLLRLGPKGSTAAWMGFDKPAAISTGDPLRESLEEALRRLD